MSKISILKRLSRTARKIKKKGFLGRRLIDVSVKTVASKNRRSFSGVNKINNIVEKGLKSLGKRALGTTAIAGSGVAFHKFRKKKNKNKLKKVTRK